MACAVKWLTPRTLDREVRVLSLALRVVSLDKELYSTFSLFTQVYKWVPATCCWGGNPAMDYSYHPVQGRSSNTPRHASCFGDRYKLRPFGPLAQVRLYLTFFYYYFRVKVRCITSVEGIKITVRLT